MRIDLLLACWAGVWAGMGCGISATHGGDWPTFRGPQRDAVSTETGLLAAWPADGPPVEWETRGAGRGYASLAIAGGMLCTLGDAPSTADDQDEYLVAFEQRTGQPLWKTRTGPAWNEGYTTWQSSRSTPTMDGERVYALTASGVLVCCLADSGQELWRKHLIQDLGGKKADGWGYSESVLVDGDQVVCTPGGFPATLAALNKRSGEVLWKSGRPNDRGAGHASIVVADVAGTRVYVQLTGSGALGVRARDGELLWSYPTEPSTAVIPTPLVRGDLVYFASGYGLGGALLRQVAGPEQTVQIEEVYPLRPELANKHGGSVLVGDFLFADSEDSGIPYCAELRTGQVRWKKRGSGSGSAAMLAADGKLYVRFGDGTMVLARATAEDFSVISSFRVPGSGERPSWSHPAIADGRLFLREQDRILCYDIRAR